MLQIGEFFYIPVICMCWIAVHIADCASIAMHSLLSNNVYILHIVRCLFYLLSNLFIFSFFFVLHVFRVNNEYGEVEKRIKNAMS